MIFHFTEWDLLFTSCNLKSNENIKNRNRYKNPALKVLIFVNVRLKRYVGILSLVFEVVYLRFRNKFRILEYFILILNSINTF